jgi:uncharacterized protein (DUF433 family)
MSEIRRITVDPGQCGGRPCIRSLRIRVKDVLDLLAAGATRGEILEDYPALEDGDITAALESIGPGHSRFSRCDDRSRGQGVDHHDGPIRSGRAT